MAHATLLDYRTLIPAEELSKQEILPQDKFLEELLKNGTSFYVDNINGEVFSLEIGQHILPVLVTTENYENSWICSPYAHYISYGRESIDLIEKQFLRKLAALAISGLGWMLRKGKMNSIVYVNHGLFSVDLHPETLNQHQISNIIALLTEKFPEHAIVFRTVNSLANPMLLESLSGAGFDLIASRYVYLTDTKNESIFTTRIIKSDLKLYRETTYTVLDGNSLTNEDISRLQELYTFLYIGKHTSLNPRCTDHFVQLMVQDNLLSFIVLKNGTRIDGVAGYMIRDGVMYCPFFGYDKNQPEHNVVYRLLNTALLLEAKKTGAIFNQGAGASFYKSIRRADGCMEWMAVFTKHLPIKQRLMWKTFELSINCAGPRYMKKY